MDFLATETQRTQTRKFKTSLCVSSQCSLCLSVARISFLMLIRVYLRRLVGNSFLERRPMVRSSTLACDDLVILALDTPQRIVLAVRVTAKAIPCENSSQIRMAQEDDAKHVIRFAFHPFVPGQTLVSESIFNPGSPFSTTSSSRKSTPGAVPWLDRGRLSTTGGCCW